MFIKSITTQNSNKLLIEINIINNITNKKKLRFMVINQQVQSKYTVDWQNNQQQPKHKHVIY